MDFEFFRENNIPIEIIEQYNLIEKIGTGGEGAVFLTTNNNVIKLFNKKIDTQVKEIKIDHLISKGITVTNLCIPTEKVYDGKANFLGYKMKLAQGETVQSCVFLRNKLVSKFPQWNRISLANLSLAILDAFSVLHKHAIIAGDINPYNIVVHDEHTIHLIDTDSFQIEKYPCTVGTTLFTPPRLQGADFKVTIRHKEDEYFAISVLLFMIFLPGKNPFAFRGGGYLAETIKAQNFSYPLGDDDNLRAPKGIWEFIWNELSYDLRRSFYDVFKKGRKINLAFWQSVISAYRDDLQKNHCPVDIYPTQLTHKIEKYKALNFNKRNIHESQLKLRNDKTNLSFNTQSPKIGVLELSTTAIKLLINTKSLNTDLSKFNFNFEDYDRPSERTDTGSLLDADSIIDIEGFKEQVIPYINKRVDYAIKNGVDVLYSVATAVYRTAFNRTEILDLIKYNCGINVKILTKKEEALATLKAFLISKPKDFVFNDSRNYMFIDQGGGSTEITIFRGQQIIETYSLNLGHSVLKNIFFKEATDKTTIEKAFKDSEKLIKDRLRVYFRNYNPQNLSDTCISVGSAIIQATGGKTTYTKHGIILTVENIKNKIEEFNQFINYNYSSMSHLYNSSKEDKIQQLGIDRKRDQVDNILIARLSLPMYIEIMERFRISNVMVSNTGLFYGIYFEKIFKF